MWNVKCVMCSLLILKFSNWGVVRNIWIGVWLFKDWISVVLM